MNTCTSITEVQNNNYIRAIICQNPYFHSRKYFRKKYKAPLCVDAAWCTTPSYNISFESKLLYYYYFILTFKSYFITQNRHMTSR